MNWFIWHKFTDGTCCSYPLITRIQKNSLEFWWHDKSVFADDTVSISSLTRRSTMNLIEDIPLIFRSDFNFVSLFWINTEEKTTRGGESIHSTVCWKQIHSSDNNLSIVIFDSSNVRGNMSHAWDFVFVIIYLRPWREKFNMVAAFLSPFVSLVSVCVVYCILVLLFIF